MSAQRRIEGYAIVSADGMIADSHAIMPDALKNEADQRFFERELDHVDVVVHGRHSHEGQPNSARRRRVTLTRSVGAIAPDPDNPKGVLWNPAGASFDEACAALGLVDGLVAIIGGPIVFSLFLDIGYDRFCLSRSGEVELPGGLPLFLQGRQGFSPGDTLRTFGLEPQSERMLDEANRVSLVCWRRKASA
jgi:hypothetical protein